MQLELWRIDELMMLP